MRQHRTVAAPRGPWRRVASIVAAGAGVMLAAGVMSACSLVYDLSTEQCSTNADCDALGGVFTGLECVNHLCQAPTITGCQSNLECIEDEGSGIDPYICRDRTCIPLTSRECPVMLPQKGELWRDNLLGDNPLVLAGTGLINGSSNYDIFLKNYDLALTEFTQKAGGVQQGARPLVMIGCRATFESSDQLDQMMAHLAQVVKVPGFVAAMDAADLQRAFVEYAGPANMFVMSPLESDPTLATLEDNGLLWHVGPGADVIAHAYAPLLTRVISHLAVTGPVRVATVTNSDQRFATNTLSTIRSAPEEYGIAFNGASVVRNRDDGNYLDVSITATEDSLVTQIGSILDFKPHVVISAASDRFLTDIIPSVETAWDAAAGGQPRPFYILSTLNYNSDALVTLVDARSELSARMAGVNGAAAENPANYERYTLAWDGAFPDSTGVRGFENFYDAAYYVIYSAAAAGQFLTGDGLDLKRGMARLLSGPEYNVGDRDIPNALQALAPASATIQLNGTLGPPDFNPISGTRESPGSVWCIDSNAVFHADRWRYRAGAGGDPTQATLVDGIAANCLTGF